MRKRSRTTASWWRRSVFLAALPAVAVSAFLGTSAAPAGASAVRVGLSSVRPFAEGILVNWATGLCLGSSGGKDNADAVMWRCDGHGDQSWSVPGTGQAGHFMNGDHECLGVAGGSTKQGAHVVVWSCQSAPNQNWYFNTSATPCYRADKPFSYFPIVNEETGLVLGVSGASTKQGAQVVTWPFQNACNNQYWSLQ